MKTIASNKTDRKKSAMITGGVHAALLIIGLIPLTASIQEQAQEQYVIPIEFAEFAQSSDEGLEATSDILIPEEKPVVEEVSEEVAIEEFSETEVEEEIIEEIETTQESEVTEDVAEVEASTADSEAEAEVDPESTGGQEATADAGEVQGADSDGSENGQNGLDGDGVITRKIIHREDITAAAHESGVIVVDVCIDRRGKILFARNNPEETTIDNMEMVRHALDIASNYRFETDYSAALRECGTLTFVFDIEKGAEGIWLQDAEAYVGSE